jgi:hypothetical protein
VDFREKRAEKDMKVKGGILGRQGSGRGKGGQGERITEDSMIKAHCMHV